MDAKSGMSGGNGKWDGGLINPKSIAPRILFCSMVYNSNYLQLGDHRMARLKLANGISPRRLGRAILALASWNDILRRLEGDEINIFKDLVKAEISKVSTAVKTQYFDEASIAEDLKLTDTAHLKIGFQNDGFDENGQYQIHVVIPDIADKRTDLDLVYEELALGDVPDELDGFKSEQTSNADTSAPEFDLTGFAEESLGNIVIFGCGR
jgi:hypothetical protein